VTTKPRQRAQPASKYQGPCHSPRESCYAPVVAGLDEAKAELLDRAAQALLAKETLDEAELGALVVGLVRREPPGADAGRTAFASGAVRDEQSA
jgi:hypothetical protein